MNTCLNSLAAVKPQYESEEDYRHAHNVAILARELSRNLGDTIATQNLIYTAGLFHDIGKQDLDQRILNKPGKLSAEQRKHIQLHVEYGVKRVLEAIKKLDPLEHIKLILYMFMHHENFDGTGYPTGEKGIQIPYGARIIRICDAFDAICSERVYKPARSAEEAIKEMRNEIYFYDPQIFHEFEKMIRYNSSI